MSLDRLASSASVIDVLDHVLDKGIVLDPALRVSNAGIDLLTGRARVLIASMHTYPASGATGRGAAHAERLERLDRISLEQRLRRIYEQLERRQLDPQAHRRAEDVVRDEHHDALAKTILQSRRRRR